MSVEKIKQIYETLKSDGSKKRILSNLDYLTYYMSIIPIPILQNIGLATNKIFENMAINAEFEEIKIEIDRIDSTLQGIQEDLERVDKIAKIVSENKNVQNKIEKLLQDLLAELKKEKPSIFTVETTKFSLQTLNNSIIEADLCRFISQNSSKNVVRDTKIKANETHLKADNSSENHFDNTEFKGPEGSVGMQNMGVIGNTVVKNASIGFGPGGGLVFRSPPVATGICPHCKNEIRVNPEQLKGYTNIQCPHCTRVVPFRIN